MVQQFFRNPTEEEKRDFTDVGPSRTKTHKEDFVAELALKRHEATKAKIPFFKKAAMDDFEQHYQGQAQISMRKNGYVKREDIKPYNIDWDKYSSPSNIELIEVYEQRDAYASKKQAFDVFVKSFRYKYKNYGIEGSHNMTVMEEEVFAVKRARATYNNKEFTEISNAEKVSELYTGKPAVKKDTKEDLDKKSK